MRIGLLVAGAVMALAVAGPAAAKDVQVKMLNKGNGRTMVFSQEVVKIAPGDTVTFVSTDPGHNAESISGMIPAGAAPFKGKMNQNLTVKFTKPGIYGYKCAPHYGMGMVGVIVVGTGGTNLAAVQKVSHPGKAKQVFANLLNSSTVKMASK
ncbi:MAG TPA: pseudoazurin [Sphingomicrobium sp.]|nr:pseudoazurin [Sphingomicrobium sp.]